MDQIIVVDDSKVNQIALKNILSSDYEVLCASSGIELFDMLEKFESKLILLDIIMPDLDGFQVIEKLKASEQYSKIPVIFITGLHDTSSEEKGFSLGAIDYITKPFNEKIVRARVHSYVQLYDFIRQAEQMGQYDGLTGLYNKKMTEKQIKRQLSSRPSLKSGALMIIDVDNFKSINDTFGHLYGDAVLTQLGSGLRSIFQKSDILGRVGGDEFFVFLRNYNEHCILEEKAKEVCSEFRKSFEQNGEIVDISASVGIATTENSFDFEDIYKFADSALYMTKAKGKNGYTFYTGEEEQVVYKSSRTDIDNDKKVHNDASENIKEFKDSLKEYVFNLVEGTKVAEYTIQSIMHMVMEQFNFDGASITKFDYEEVGVKCIADWISSEKDVPPVVHDITFKEVLDIYDKFDKTNIAIIRHNEKTLHDVRKYNNDLYRFALKNKKALLGCITFAKAPDKPDLHPRLLNDFVDVCQQLSSVVVNQFLIENALNEKNNFTSILNGIDDPVYVASPDCKKPLFINEAAQSADIKLHNVECVTKTREDGKNNDCPLYKAIQNGGFYENSEVVCKEIEWTNNIKAYVIRHKNFS